MLKYKYRTLSIESGSLPRSPICISDGIFASAISTIFPAELPPTHTAFSMKPESGSALPSGAQERVSDNTRLPRVIPPHPSSSPPRTKNRSSLRVQGIGDTFPSPEALASSPGTTIRFDSALSAGFWIVSRFVPLIGWATAWSFDRLRLWAETGQSPETSRDLSAIHAIARVVLAFVLLWHGLVPKLLFHNIDERIMLSQAGLAPHWLSWIGSGEILLGLLVLFTWNRRSIFLFGGALMVLATLTVSIKSPAYLRAAFNPITLNLAVLALCIVGWISSHSLPSARRCLRVDPRTQR